MVYEHSIIFFGLENLQCLNGLYLSTIVANYSLDANCNAFVYLPNPNGEGGMVGITYTGVTCEADFKNHTSLYEYMTIDIFAKALDIVTLI